MFFLILFDSKTVGILKYPWIEMCEKEEIFCSVFKTRWGWFGLAGSRKGLMRSCLPLADKDAVYHALGGHYARFFDSNSAFSEAEERIGAYFEGSRVDLSSIPVKLVGLTDFQRDILLALKSVTYSNIVTYSQLAQMAARPGAARAAGLTVAQNPIPLIIPCHRVIRSDGKLGGFSAPGGVEIKQRMLDLEKSAEKA